MFTGIVRGIGSVLEVRGRSGDRGLTLGIDGTDVPAPEPGSSICVNGVCLTATRAARDRFEADVSAETLSVTTCGGWSAGTRVNLEPGLKVGDPLDGHWVTGHVDGTGRILVVRSAARSSVYEIEAPAELARFIAKKGSIAVDGVSLTVNAVSGRVFEVNVIPYTQQKTIFAAYRVDATVNIEVDIVARYLDRLRAGGDAAR